MLGVPEAVNYPTDHTASGEQLLDWLQPLTVTVKSRIWRVPYLYGATTPRAPTERDKDRMLLW